MKHQTIPQKCSESFALAKATLLQEMASPFFFVFLLSGLLLGNTYAGPNYREALSKSLLFFQGQRSGRLPDDQKLSWRFNSGLSDGSSAHVRPSKTIYIYFHSH